MWSHARRLLADVRQVGGWVITLFVAVLVVSTLAAYMLVFAVADGRSGVLATGSPQDPVSLLRVIDPNDSIVTVVETVEELDESVLDEPGLRILTDQMRRDDRMFMVMSLNAFTSDAGEERQVDTNPQAIVGASPPFLPDAPPPGAMMLWGSLVGSTPVPDVSDRSIVGHPVLQVSTERLAATYMAGSGLFEDTRDAPTVAFDVATARALGVTSPPGVADVVRSFTCYCDVTDLAKVAEEMSDAELRAGTGRVFYAIDHAGAIGPVQRSRALSETLGAGHAIATLLSIGWLTAMLARLFWSRRAPTYLVERLCGSSETAIQIRAQVLLAASLALPAVAGYELVNALVTGAASPPPLPPETRIAALAVIGLLYSAAGLPTISRIHRLCKFDVDELRRL